VRQELLHKQTKKGLAKAFPTIHNGGADLYVYFYGKGIENLKEKGILGYITPNKWLERQYGTELRQFLKPLKIEKLIDFGELRIFEDASTEPAIVIISKEISDAPFLYASIKELKVAQESDVYDCKLIHKSDLRDDIWRFADYFSSFITAKFAKDTISLAEYTKSGVYYGIKTGYNKAFIIDQATRDALVQADPNAEKILRKEVEGEDFGKWSLKHTGKYLIFFPRNEYDIADFPSINQYLLKHYDELKPKTSPSDEKGRKQGGYKWFEVQDNVAYYKIFDAPKLIYYHTALEHNFYYDTEGYYISANCYFIANADRYLQCILNSKLFHFCKKYLFPAFGDVEKGGRVRLDANKMATLPIKPVSDEVKEKFRMLAEKIVMDTAAFEKQNNRAISLFKAIFPRLSINRNLDTWYNLSFAEFRIAVEKQKIEMPIRKLGEYIDVFAPNAEIVKNLHNQINITNNAIDKLVYQLYELSPSEIQIIATQ
jgi:TaqI-like C-terminal specificity domain/Eco57I restriction-modification methylase